jgi:formyltetrahydrofolate hydrolase
MVLPRWEMVRPIEMDPSPLATLLVSCPDRKGLVAELAQILYKHGANILDADQHTDLLAGIFFSAFAST